MKTTKIVQIHGFTGYGATVKEAKQDAIRQIESLNGGTWTPVTREFDGFSVLVYRTLEGWSYRFLQQCGLPVAISPCSQGFGDDFQECLRSAEDHLVQNWWVPGKPITIVPDFISEESRLKEIISYRKWQLSFAHLRANGMDHVQAHAQASAKHYDEIVAEREAERLAVVCVL